MGSLNHSEWTPINLSKPHRTIEAGVIMMNSETEILDVAPIDLLNSVSKKFMDNFPDYLWPAELKAQALDINFHWVNETGKPARATAGISIQPTDDFNTCPVLDIVVIGAASFGYQPSEKELDFVRKQYEHCEAFITICGGFQPALMAGVLKGKSVTAPRLMIDQLKQQAPETTWVGERWHRDGKIWTSGPLLNGLDLMRAFATEYWGGPGTLMEHALELGHYPSRDVMYGDAPTDM